MRATPNPRLADVVMLTARQRHSPSRVTCGLLLLCGAQKIGFGSTSVTAAVLAVIKVLPTLVLPSFCAPCGAVDGHGG